MAHGGELGCLPSCTQVPLLFLLTVQEVNGFDHGRGLRQGDPVLSLLFVLAIDPPQRLFDRATQLGMLQPIQHRSVKLRVSLYADDETMFFEFDDARDQCNA